MKNYILPLLRQPLYIVKNIRDHGFGLYSDETESFFLPFALREFMVFLPLCVDILSLNPCLFALFLRDG